MDIVQIRYFIRVAAEKNISAAAKILHISQPPLSRHIKALEDELNLTLFRREKNGLFLTLAGQLFLERAETLVYQFDSIAEEMQVLSSQTKRQISLGSIDSSSFLVEPVYQKLFRKKYYAGQLKSQVGTAEEISNKILNKEIDIAFVRYPFAKMELFDHIVLYKEHWCAFIAENNFLPLHNQDSISIEQLHEHKLLMPSRQSLYLPIVNALTIDDKKPLISCYYFEIANAAYLAKQAKTIAIVPEIIHKLISGANYSLKPIAAILPETGYMAIKLKNEFNSDTVNEFWNIIRNFKFSLSD